MEFTPKPQIRLHVVHIEKILLYLLPLLTHVVHATSDIRRIFSRQLPLLCNHWSLLPSLAPNVSIQ